MHGLRGNGAREKTALMPDPLWRSSFGFTTLHSRRGYGHGAPKEVKRYPEPMAHGSEACEPSHPLWPMAPRPVSRHTRAEAADTG